MMAIFVSGVIANLYLRICRIISIEDYYKYNYF